MCIFDSNNGQEFCVLCGTVRSTYFYMANGMKQGSRIYAIFFSLYYNYYTLIIIIIIVNNMYIYTIKYYV